MYYSSRYIVQHINGSVWCYCCFNGYTLAFLYKVNGAMTSVANQIERDRGFLVQFSSTDIRYDYLVY